jgi:hypothetical protein
MSVESGIGVACGCLPGCKPLMNKMFPRIFATTSQASGYPRQSGKNPAKQMSTPSQSGQDSVQLQTSNQDVILVEKTFDLESGLQLPAAPPPSRQGLRPPSRLMFGRSARKYGELDEGSNSSMEMIILQRGSVDERYWTRDGRQF